jgi:hypothetical protein
MAQKFLTNIDLNQNQLIKGQFESVASDPGTNNFEGRLIYNSTEKVIKVYTGAAWRKALHAISSETTALTTSESNGTVTLTIAVADAVNAGLLSSTGFSLLNGATANNTVSTLVQRDASGNFSAGTITASLTGNVSGNLTGDVTGTVSSLSNHTTTNLAEGTNLYYTDTRVRDNRLDQLAAPTADVSFNSRKITNLLDPVNAQDAATKAYVDAARSGLDVKDSVRAATTANITLSNLQTIDGVALADGDRVLVKNQDTASENGIYVAVDGDAWTRSTDADTDLEVTAGLFTFVEEGTVNADSGWVLTTNNPITVGTTNLTFAQFSGAGAIIAGDGLSKTGNTIDVGGTTDRITVTADSVDIASTYVGQSSITTLGTIGTGTWQGTAVAIEYGGTGATSASVARTNLADTPASGLTTGTPVLARIASQLIGDGSNTAYTITHNLGTRDVVVQVFDASTYETVVTDVVRTNTNSVTVTFSVAPDSNAFKVVVTG